MDGTVIKSTGSFYLVKCEGDRLVVCRIRGKFRQKNHRLTNPVSVGDFVRLSEDEDIEGVRNIEEIYERKNCILRKSNKLSSRAQIIASNLDLVLVFVTLKSPFTSTGFVDRILLTSEAYGIPAAIVFNKADTYGEEEYKIVLDLKNLYESIGYKCFEADSTDSKSLIEIGGFLKDKVVLIAGHSGVGKSTFVNQLISSAEQKTHEISSFSDKGQHTTTFAEMFYNNSGISLIDTPGIRDFGVLDIEDQKLSHYFPDFKEFIPNCKFNNCLHNNEPDCGIKMAVEEGEIDSERYYNYLSILRNEDSFN
jgi:ribosome biogenesis GTPase